MAIWEEMTEESISGAFSSPAERRMATAVSSQEDSIPRTVRDSGMEEELVHMLGAWSGIPVTYAGGISSLEDLDKFRRLSGGNIDFTIGSALDLFGGDLPYETVKRFQ